MNDLPALLLRDFDAYRRLTRHYFSLQQQGNDWIERPLKLTEERRKLLATMVAWCHTQMIEPRLWLFSLFAGRSWFYSPRWTEGDLCSEKMIPKFRKRRGIGVFRKRVATTSAQAAQESQLDPNRDLIHAAEALKSRFLSTGQQARCLDEILVRTLGYHPRSPVCAACSVKIECAARIQGFVTFDILALREGRITSSQAEDAAREAAHARHAAAVDVHGATGPEGDG